MSFNYEWNLKDAVFTKDKGKVFSCFACGGGSTMGYKLAGFDVIGMNEIDPKMAACYIENHKPKYSFIEPIQEFKNKKELPEELFDLDILDGSPPCSSFSVCGNREADWGKEKKFREGQAVQVLDDLFFHFIDLAKRLHPKIIVAENVKGLLLGEAKSYVTKILASLEDSGYKTTYKLLNASKMGVPQRRERVFFISVRNDIDIDTIDLFSNEPYINLEFDEKEIVYSEIKKEDGPDISKLYYNRWQKRKKSDNSFSDICSREEGKIKCFSDVFCKKNSAIPTITGKGFIVDFDSGKRISSKSLIKAGSFPADYNFLDQKISYLIGMSVPPVMMAKIADRIYNQWLKK